MFKKLLCALGIMRPSIRDIAKKYYLLKSCSLAYKKYNPSYLAKKYNRRHKNSGLTLSVGVTYDDLDIPTDLIIRKAGTGGKTGDDTSRPDKDCIS